MNLKNRIAVLCVAAISLSSMPAVIAADSSYAASQKVETTAETTTTSAATTAAGTTIKFKVGSKHWFVNNVEMEHMDATPFVKDDYIYLPIRYAAIALGTNPKDIAWNEKNETATLKVDDKVIKLKVGAKYMIVDGKSQSLKTEGKAKTPVVINKDSRIYIPVSKVTDLFDSISVDWDDAEKTVFITKKAVDAKDATTTSQGAEVKEDTEK